MIRKSIEKVTYSLTDEEVKTAIINFVNGSKSENYDKHACPHDDAVVKLYADGGASVISEYDRR